MRKKHMPVLLSETLEYLSPKPGETFIDCTLGAGGHAAAVLEKTAPDGKLLGIDLDPQAIVVAQENLKPYGERAMLVRGNFADLKRIASSMNLSRVDGALLDLGVSSLQLDQPERGFSFKSEADLDMRLDPLAAYTAAEAINDLTQAELKNIFAQFGEERWASKISSKIVDFRKRSRIQKASQLAEIVAGAIPKKFQNPKIHPATRVFQSLRIYVNDELDNLKSGLKAAIEVLNVKGRICVISFHSLEDRIVKSTFRDMSKLCVCPPDFPVCRCSIKPKIEILTKKPITPKPSEVQANLRSRSAKLRAAVKVGGS